jgi:uncharacterized sulfatase
MEPGLSGGRFGPRQEEQMTRRDFVKALGAGIDGRPNIVFLLVDEMRFPSVFRQGIDTPAEFLRNVMPNLYELWRRGVKFERYYTAGNACSPARATLATGLYPHQQWLAATRTKGGPSLQTAFPTYGRLLRGLGYDTPYIGKWHLSNAPTPPSTSGYLEDYGFQGMTNPDQLGTNGQGKAVDPEIADQAEQWLATRRGVDKPFCLTVSFVNPHDKQFFWGGSEGDTYNALFQAPLAPLVKGYTSVPVEDSPQPRAYPALPPNWESEADLERHHKPTTHTL